MAAGPRCSGDWRAEWQAARASGTHSSAAARAEMANPRAVAHCLHRGSVTVVERAPGVAPESLTAADVPPPRANSALENAVAIVTGGVVFG